MKLSKWAKQQGIQYGTALKWFHSGKLPCPAVQTATGTILVQEESPIKEKELRTFVYSRVSSATKKQDLESQQKLCEQFCLARGWEIEKSFKEIASGMNDNRPKLNKLLTEKGARIVCLHKDRLTRFGANYIKKVVENNGGELVIVNPDLIEEEDLLKDFSAIITSFCCRLYGARRGQSKALKMKEVLLDS